METIGIITSISTVGFAIATAVFGPKFGKFKALALGYSGRLKRVFSEASEFVESAEAALEDNKLTPDELRKVIKEAKDVVIAVKAIANPEEDTQD